MPKRTKVDPEICIGCRLCTNIAPASYEMNDDNKSVANESQPDSEDTLKETIDACPVTAISWKDE